MRGTVIKIQEKTFKNWLWNQFYSFCCFIFSTLEDILSRSEVPLPRYRWKCLFAVFETGFTAFRVLILGLYVIFSTLEVTLYQLEVPLPRYGWKLSFAIFETGFTTFSVLILGYWSLFLELWRLFWINTRYHCQDTNKNVHIVAFKLVLRH